MVSQHLENFFKDRRLPFAECRYTVQSSETFKPHLHRNFCVGAAESGEIIFQVSGQEALLGKGVLALINPDTLHCCNPRGASERSFSMLYLNTDWCLQVQQSLWQNSEFIPVDCILAKDPGLYDLYFESVECLMGVTHLLEKEQHLVTLAEAIFARCCYPTVPVASMPKGVAELKEWLASELEEDHTLEMFAGEVNLNPYTLLRNFRNSYGVTPYAFRTNCRIEYGRKLLQQGADIGDTALMCGFFDQSHFHKHFKAMTSVTPGKYQLSFL